MKIDDNILMGDIKAILKNNRGASLVIIVAIFALIMVLCLNVMMAANATTNSLSGEYEADRINLYVSSVYHTLNQVIESGDMQNVFPDDENDVNELEFSSGGNDNGNHKVGLNVRAEASRKGSDGVIDYYIKFEGNEYHVQATYTVKPGQILVKRCTGIID